MVLCSAQEQWEKAKCKGRCQCHASGDGEGQGQNDGYLFHGSPPLSPILDIARTGQGLP
jgi:hypothetical protein